MNKKELEISKYHAVRIEAAIFLWKHFREYTVSKFSNMLQAATLAIEIRKGNELIAVGVVEDGHLTFAAVEENFRGSGLQIILIKERLEALKQSHSRVGASVRAKNVASLKNMLRCRFEIESTFRYENDDLGYELSYKFPEGGDFGGPTIEVF